MEGAGWEQLGVAAGSGDLSLERGAARKCAERCDELLTRLKAIQHDSVWLARVEGFGGLLPSGVVLASKFERKATGGEYSLDRALADHIAIVEQMRTVFETIESRYAAAEEANTTAATAVESQIN